jgi:prepilin-type N-terminal cleavage/methylation domain-containing protein
MRRKINGFTLLEMLLVITIAASMIGVLLNFTTTRIDQERRDRTAIQMQQILNAGLAYYVGNGNWPSSLAALQGAYLPSGKILSGWGGTYTLTSTNTLLSVATTLLTVNDAAMVAGMVPLGNNLGPMPAVAAIANCIYYMNSTGYATGPPACGQPCPGTAPEPNPPYWTGYFDHSNPSGSTCVPTGTTPSTTVTGSVTIPGQNLNNARAINYAGVYNHGACVPAPVCPTGMQAQIFTAPGSVAAVTSVSGCTSPTGNCTNIATSPIYSFTTYVMGNSASDNTPVAATPGPMDCASGADLACSGGSSDTTGTTYWRVCLQVTNQNGKIPTPASADQGVDMGQIMAFTRCSTPGEPTGTPVNVWTGP